MSCGNHLMLFLGFSLLLFLNGVSSSINYGDSLTKSLLYFEAQRSGRLPANQRVQWRGDSGLKDGSDNGVDLVGGYYDAGDNVKHGFPMAFTITMLAWSATEFHRNLIMKNELSHTLEAIKWGTDYLMKAHPQPNVFYGEVGDADSDHDCWQRPEDMTTPRPSFKIDEAHPGSDLAGESAAALAAAAIAFGDTDPNYSKQLLIHAKQLFEFAKNYQGLYQTSIPVVAKYYSSSGFQDELLWAAAWLHQATNDKIYLDYLASTPDTGGIRTMFSWDDKFVGAQTLVARLVLEQQVESSGIWNNYKSQAEAFICTIIDKGASQGKKTPGGLKWWQPFNNLQYTTSAMFILTAYSAYLTTSQKNLSCPNGNVDHEDLIVFVHSQAGYILGSNPKSLSYMVGFGPNYPKKVHHRGASIVSIKNDPTTVTCKGGFDWFNKDSPNPNVIDGAIVGGPDLDDSYTDSRSNFLQAQAATVTTAPLVGVLARLST